MPSWPSSVSVPVTSRPRTADKLMASTGPATEVAALLERVAHELAIDPVLAQVQLIDAGDLVEHDRLGARAAGLFTGTVLRPMLIVNLDDTNTPGSVARFLGKRVPAEHRLTLLEIDPAAPGHACTSAEFATSGRHIAAIYVPAVDELEAGADPRRIQRIVARLRAPGGCPWDHEQTHRSLRAAIIDEAYEVTDAIDSGDPDNLAEELGDLLLLITMHAQIAAEAGTFTIEDVQRSIATKIVGRHPHVFGDEVVETDADLSRIWKEAKARERSARPGKGGGKDLDGEPRSMPALTRASRVLRKHPVPADPGLSTPEQRAERLLRAVAEIVAVDDDPEAVLRAALIRLTTADSEIRPFRSSTSDGPRLTPGK